MLVATHPRSGTHLTIDLLRRNFSELHSRKRPLEPLDTLYVPIDIAIDSPTVNVCRARRLVQRHRYPILKSHYLEPDYSNLADDAVDLRAWMNVSVKTIYVVRNPEKVLASFYVFVKSFQSNATPTPEWLISSAKGWVSHVQRWSHRNDTLVLRFEDLMRNTKSSLYTVADFLNIEPVLVDPLLPPRLISKWRGRWIRLFGTDSPTTEILTGDQQGVSFKELFGGAIQCDFWDVVKPIAQQFGYVQS